jgi:GH25 family lysozyme M1 (1,4-beta-N-acetylmuramidase)
MKSLIASKSRFILALGVLALCMFMAMSVHVAYAQSGSLSATEAELETMSASDEVDLADLHYRARIKSSGWQSWKTNGETAGTTGKSKMLTGFAMYADSGTLLSGGIKYRTHVSNVGWQDWKANGEVAGKKKERIEAVCIKLTGVLALNYDVYYRAHVQDYGWLDWAKNGAEAGSTGYALRIEAIQVKLVPKGGAAPGTTKYPTANLLEKSWRLDGIDISSWQAGIDLYSVPADFVIVKATQGNWYKNPFFVEHANATLDSGKLLGIYHFADLEGSATAQANYFIKAVKPYLGQCVLVLDWEAEALDLGPAWAKKFMKRVYKKTGVKPIIYLSQSETWNHDWSSVAGTYQLWLAQYLYSNMDSSGYLRVPNPYWGIGYWDEPIMYQYSSTGKLSGYGGSLDLNKFYGSAVVWRELCAIS